MSTIIIDVPDELHPNTAELVSHFASAMASKLRSAELKHGYSDHWMQADWQAECHADFLRHISKGDPVDVANYCAFMWKRGWSTNSKKPACPCCGATYGLHCVGSNWQCPECACSWYESKRIAPLQLTVPGPSLKSV
jgi:hypothetical protein